MKKLKNGEVIFDEFKDFFTSSNTTCASKPLTIEKIKEAIASIPKCPITEYMIERGFDPKKGGRLMLPITLFPEFGDNLPDCIHYSVLVNEPVLINVPYQVAIGRIK